MHDRNPGPDDGSQLQGDDSSQNDEPGDQAVAMDTSLYTASNFDGLRQYYELVNQAQNQHDPSSVSSPEAHINAMLEMLKAACPDLTQEELFQHISDASARFGQMLADNGGRLTVLSSPQHAAEALCVEIDAEAHKWTLKLLRQQLDGPLASAFYALYFFDRRTKQLVDLPIGYRLCRKAPKWTLNEEEGMTDDEDDEDNEDNEDNENRYEIINSTHEVMSGTSEIEPSKAVHVGWYGVWGGEEIFLTQPGGKVIDFRVPVSKDALRVHRGGSEVKEDPKSALSFYDGFM
ncbi:hypothetical protein FA95DRAFT_1420595 [Auriscalpium vulgare]|uniref:Uncharacterized protein n=1 Tax=Auriscalpium vulgare TaxID=40419 RepID=A0ACB8RPU1_9AGAM|nr:hypothetical protein FA95DRAFT_1420595 [Auriscalpium vulgare]